ncbi:MAG: hypothetical protein ACJAUN_000777 [Alcanivorax sp.]|jgi:hypothetical protein
MLEDLFVRPALFLAMLAPIAAFRMRSATADTNKSQERPRTIDEKESAT